MAGRKPTKMSHLTNKQRMFMKAVVGGKSKTQAADEIYDCATRESARVVGSVTWKSIESVLEQEYDKYGLSKELILTALVEDIKANPGKRERLLDMGGKFLGMGVERKTIEHTGKGIESLFGEIDDVKRIDIEQDNTKGTSN